LIVCERIETIEPEHKSLDLNVEKEEEPIDIEPIIELMPD
jgi:hypothetical protein